MTDEEQANLRQGVERYVRAALGGNRFHWWDGDAHHDDLGWVFALNLRVTLHTGDGPPLSPGKGFALTVLLAEDDATIERALADYMLDQGFEYALAVAEKARREEREAISERLYSEASRLMSRAPDPNDTYEFAAAALSSVADDLVMVIPPTAPETTAEGD